MYLIPLVINFLQERRWNKFESFEKYAGQTEMVLKNEVFSLGQIFKYFSIFFFIKKNYFHLIYDYLIYKYILVQLIYNFLFLVIVVIFFCLIFFFSSVNASVILNGNY